MPVLAELGDGLAPGWAAGLHAMIVGASWRSAMMATVGWVFGSSDGLVGLDEAEQDALVLVSWAETSWLPMAGPPARTWILTPVSSPPGR